MTVQSLSITITTINNANTEEVRNKTVLIAFIPAGLPPALVTAMAKTARAVLWTLAKAKNPGHKVNTYIVWGKEVTISIG